MINDLLIENDKINAPFLLAASFNGLIKFLGSQIQNNTLYWQFSPKEQAQKLIDQLHTKTEPRIPAKDIFEATSTFWKQIEELRNDKKGS
jgi:hypothetical protein